MLGATAGCVLSSWVFHAPGRGTALSLIDVINDPNFKDSLALAAQAEPTVLGWLAEPCEAADADLHASASFQPR